MGSKKDVVRGERRMQLVFSCRTRDETGDWVFLNRERGGLQEAYLLCDFLLLHKPQMTNQHCSGPCPLLCLSVICDAFFDPTASHFSGNMKYKAYNLCSERPTALLHPLEFLSNSNDIRIIPPILGAVSVYHLPLMPMSQELEIQFILPG